MKKIFTPLIYTLPLFILTALAVGSEMQARNIGLLPEYSSVIEPLLAGLIFGTIIIFGIPLFWLTNYLIQKLEKITKPNFYDHLRQSIFFYLLIIYSFSTWALHGFSGSEEDGYLLIWLGISITAILVNYFFLFYKKQR